MKEIETSSDELSFSKSAFLISLLINLKIEKTDEKILYFISTLLNHLSSQKR